MKTSDVLSIHSAVQELFQIDSRIPLKVPFDVRLSLAQLKIDLDDATKAFFEARDAAVREMGKKQPDGSFLVEAGSPEATTLEKDLREVTQKDHPFTLNGVPAAAFKESHVPLDLLTRLMRLGVLTR